MKSEKAQSMEVTVRVISDGHEVERITRPLRTDEQGSAVTYRKRLWPIIDGCIHIDGTSAVSEGDELAWALLVTSLLPKSLPEQVGACSKLLRTLFRESLPLGVVQAAATLASLRFEQQTRALLVDVLKDRRDADRLYRLLQMQLLFRDRTERAKDATPSVEDRAEVQPLTEIDLDWEWAPSNDKLEKPNLDDSTLRSDAALLQKGMGTYKASEAGAIIPELSDLAGDEAWLEAISTLAKGDQQSSMQENVLVDRTAKLGETALDLLRYFADNPGDRAAHAEHILGYPISDINRLLTGGLSHYIKRNSSGGWECHAWTVEVLSALDESSNET
jgi:hypothetical protein